MLKVIPPLTAKNREFFPFEGGQGGDPNNKSKAYFII